MATITGSITLSLSTVPALTTGTVALSAAQVVAGGYYAITSFPITTWTAVYLGAITQDLGYIFFKNNSTTNYIEIATDNAGAKIFTKLTAGKFAFIQAHSGVAAYWIRANTAACPVLIWAVKA